MAELANCKRCHGLFHKHVSEVCPDCFDQENREFQKLFRRLQASRDEGGILIDDLAQEVGIPVAAIEAYYHDSRLGTAGIFLKFKCRECGAIVDEKGRKGRFCINCSEKVSTIAGVEVKSRQSIQREDEKMQEASRNMDLLNQPARQAPQTRRTGKAGFIRYR